MKAKLIQLDQSVGWFLERVASGFVLAILGFTLLIGLIYQIVSIQHRYMIDYGEAPLVDQALRLAEGQNIYRPDISTPPYTISNYPPLYVVVLAPLVKLFGAAFWQGRLISTLCAWLAAYFLYLIIYQRTQDRLAGALSGMIFMAFPYVVHWSGLARIDLLAMAFSIAGLYYLTQWPQSWKRFAVGAVLLTAAIYTRQSYALAAPAAAFFWLLFRNWKRALLLAAVVGGMSLVIFLGLNLATHGGFFYNIVTANVNEFGMPRLMDNLKNLRNTALVLLFFGAASIFFTSRKSQAWWLVAPYLAGAAISTLTIGKIGSNINYFLELCAALSMCAGVVVAWFRSNQKTSILRAIVLVCLFYQAQTFLHIILYDKAESLRYWFNMYSAQIQVDELVSKTNGPILADEGMGMIVLNHRHLVLQPFEVTQLARAGKWDQGPLLESIQQKEYPLILIHDYQWYPVYKERWTTEMLNAIDRNYAYTEKIADERIYRPIGTNILEEACPNAPWQLPSKSDLGVQYHDHGLDFFGLGNEGRIPVYAVADGLLTRKSDWKGAVAILHEDPLRPGEMVWTYYGDMMNAQGDQVYVASDFPLGSAAVPVVRGQLIGYQGKWGGGKPMQTSWAHVRFYVVKPTTDGGFPSAITNENTLDLRPYLGLELRPGTEYPYSQTPACK